MNKKLKHFLIGTVSVITAAAVGAGALYAVKQNQKNNLVVKVNPVEFMATQYWNENTIYGYVQSGYKQSVYGREDDRVLEFYVEEGQSVRVGDPLLQLDPTQLYLDMERLQLNLDAMAYRHDRLEQELNDLKNTKPSDASSLYGTRLNDESAPVGDAEISDRTEESWTPEDASGEESLTDESSGQESTPDESLVEESSAEDSEVEESAAEESSGEESQPDDSSHEETSHEDESSHEESSQGGESSHEDESSREEEFSHEESSHEESSHEESRPDDPTPVEPEPAEGPLQVLTDRSKPYSGTGTERDPYHYWISNTTKMTASFYKDRIDEPVYCVFDKTEKDEKDGDIEYSWYFCTVDAAAPKGGEIYNLGLYQIPMDIQSIIMIVPEDAFPGPMTLSLNLESAEIEVEQVSIVGSDILEEKEPVDNRFLVQLEHGGVYNLYYTVQQEDPGEDPGTIEPEPYYPPYYPPYVPSGPTKAELLQQIAEKEVEIRDLEISQKMAGLELEKTEKKLYETVVLSSVNGTVTSLDPTGNLYGEPFAVVSGTDGFYVMATISEFDLGQLALGDTVYGTSWMTGQTYEGHISAIGEIPESAGGFGSSSNPNVSFYPVTIYFETDSVEPEGSGIELTMNKADSASEESFCIPSMYIREEDGRYYVLADRDGVLEKRYVQLGRQMWEGEYFEVLEGLTQQDYLAFPYGKAAREGVRTRREDEMVNPVNPAK